MRQPLLILIVFCLAASRLASAAPDQWLQVASPHFTVITNSDDKQAHTLLDRFERLRWFIQTSFPNVTADPAIPIVILAARDEATFQSLAPKTIPAKGSSAATSLFLKTPDKNYFFLRLDAEGPHPFATIYRQYLQLQFGNTRERLPLWLTEGLARFIQSAEFHDANLLLGAPNSDDVLALRQGHLLPLPALFKVAMDSPNIHDPQTANLFYAESWALAHYLEATDHLKNTHRLGDYISLVIRRDNLSPAEKAFGDLKQLQVELNASIQSAGYKHFPVSSAAATIDESSYRSRTLTSVESDSVRADILICARRNKDARTILDAVLRSQPANVPALEIMGYLSYQEGDKAAARKSFQSAIKTDPQSYRASCYLAAASIDESNPAKDTDAEARLRAAIKLNPNFAPADDQLANLFALRRKNLVDAFVMSARAVKLDPANLAYRLDNANVLGAMGQYLDAALFLRNSINAVDNPDDAAKLLDKATQLDALKSISQQAAATSSATQESPAQETPTQEAPSAANPPEDPDKAYALPKHPTETPNGPKHIAIGVIRGVACSYPAVIEFHLAAAAKQVSLYSNNYFKIDLTALNFTPKDSMNLCKDLEGVKAKVQYAESSDKTIDGQVISIEMRK
jgi:tetratricopeptide (TPR) repeat protein